MGIRSKEDTVRRYDGALERSMSVPSAFDPLGSECIETYLIKVDNVPRNEANHLHFGQNPAVTQDYTFLCQGPLEFMHNVPSLIVLNEANNCIEQEQAGNYSQIDPILQAGSQYESQLQKQCQLETIRLSGARCRGETGLRGMYPNLQA